jgi:hypothetical protein
VIASPTQPHPRIAPYHNRATDFIAKLARLRRPSIGALAYGASITFYIRAAQQLGDSFWQGGVCRTSARHFLSFGSPVAEIWSLLCSLGSRRRRLRARLGSSAPFA